MLAQRNNRVNACKIGISLLLAVIGVCLLSIVLGATRKTGYRFIWVVAAVVLGFLCYRFLLMKDVRAKRLFGLLGFLFSMAQALGYRLQTANNTGKDGLLLCIGIGVCLAPAAGYGFVLLSNVLDCAKSADMLSNRKSLRKVYWLSFVVILLCWIPVFLAYYPGLFAYDADRQVFEVINDQFTGQHPILHTLYLGELYLLGGVLGDHNIGIALAVMIQMIAMVAVFSWLLRYMASLGSARALCWVALAIFALLPIHPMLAISCTKDTLFCGAMLLFAIRLHQLSRMPALLREMRWFLPTLGIMALICLLRNNAFFSILMCIPLGLFMVPRKLRLRLVTLVLGALIVYMGIGQALKVLTHAGGINSAELLSIPCQQMARVYNLYHDEYPPSAEIEAYLPTAAYYNIFTADVVKAFANVKKPGQMWGFIKLWGKVGLQYPVEYLDAFLLNTQGYWWLDDTAHASIYGEGLENRQGYLLTDTKQGYGVSHFSLLPPLEMVLENLFSANEYQRIPILSLLFAPGLYLWLAAFGLVRAVVSRQWDCAVVCVFLFCYMVTLLFGPCVLIRYAYPFVACLPLILFLPAKGSKNADKDALEAGTVTLSVDVGSMPQSVMESPHIDFSQPACYDKWQFPNWKRLPIRQGGTGYETDQSGAPRCGHWHR